MKLAVNKDYLKKATYDTFILLSINKLRQGN